MSQRIQRTFATRDALVDALALALAERMGRAVRERGQALIAVSGGQSPKPIFARLALQALPWNEVTVTLVDERWVDAASADSNERMVREQLLAGPAGAARFVALKNSAATAEAGRARCEASLQALPRPFDATIVGMGEDGHTASLFPAAHELATALDTARPDLCTPVNPPAAPHARMSLTLRGLLDSRVLILPLLGKAKLATLRAADSPGPVEAMPVRALLRQSQTPLEIWSTEEG